MGHALVSLALPGSETVQKISIIPRGIGALGFTIQRPTEDRYLMSRKELESRKAMLLGGRAAETMRFEDVSTGAADDLAKATDIARGMVTLYGMGSELGAISYESDPTPLLGTTPSESWRPRRYAEATAARMDAAVKAVIDNALSAAMEILRQHEGGLDAAAARLLDCETLRGSELAALVAQADATVAIPQVAVSQPQQAKLH